MSDTPALPHGRPFVRGMFVLAGSIVLAALIGTCGLIKLRSAGDEIEVTGSARRRVDSDLVVWKLAVTSTRPTLADALRNVTAQGARVAEFLKRERVDDKAVDIKPLVTSTIAERVNSEETGRTAAYRVTQAFEVSSRDLAVVVAATQHIGNLLGQGVAVDADAPQFLYAKLPEMRVSLLADAVKDARSRADQIAAAAGASVGRVKSVKVGVFQVTKPNSTDVSDYGTYDTGSRDKDVTAVVRVTFAFK